MTLFFLIVLGAFALYVMTADERAQLVRTLLAATRRGKDAAVRNRRQPDPWGDVLRARTRWVFVTPALVALNVTIFVRMLFGPGALSDPETLVNWGGNFGLRTTNGEWWRLVTTMFVHSGMLQLLVNLVGLVPLGFILERLVGHVAFAAVYITAGVFASLVSTYTHPVATSVGASGAIFGSYGLLLAALIWGTFHRSTVTVPLRAVKRLGPAAAVFILYNMAAGGLERDAEILGLVTGLACGLVLMKGVSDRKPSVRRVAAAMATTAVIAVVLAFPLRGLADVRPEIERVVAVEDRTASTYKAAVERFKSGRITTEGLAQLIDRTIMPELHAAQARLKALDRVPHEHQPLVASAEEYLRLRDASWRLRVEGLHKAKGLTVEEPDRTHDENWRLRAEGMHRTNLLTLGEADRTERASLEALEKIRPSDQK